MVKSCEDMLNAPAFRPAPRVSYRHVDADVARNEVGTLAVFSFGAGAESSDDPRCLRVDLECFDAPAPLEIWQVDGVVDHGRAGALQWSAGSGWLFAAICLDEREYGGIREASTVAYRQLREFIGERSERHVLRIWNYLGAINRGEDDAERYKQFCDGRAAGLGDFFAEGFPAATAIGHHAAEHRLQMYLLACDQPGLRVENPRQVSSWHYPRQYGRTSPGFARAMALPERDVLAISGTAAVVGHASAHRDDLDAQLEETLTNLEALLRHADMAAGFDTHSPLKAYVRHPADAPRVREFLRQRLPGVPVLQLHGDVCRSELLVELDGWRYA